MAGEQRTARDAVAGEGVIKRWVLALTAAGTFMVILDAMVVAANLSAIRQDLGASLEALEWTMNAFNLAFAVLLLPGAALGDRFGRRRLFIVGLGLFVVASAGCALAAGPAGLILARAAQGAAAALVTPLAMALLSAAFPPAERGRALGLFAGLTGLALILGPVVGGAITEGLAWRWIFWLNLPIGAVLIPLARARIPESRGPAASLDAPGVVLVAAAAFSVVWGLMRGNHAGWGSAEVVASLIAGVVLAAAFVIWEGRAAAPMVPLRFFRARAFSAGLAACFLFNAAMYGVLFLLPQFFQTAQGNGPLGAGLRLLPWTATLFVVAPLSGRLINRVGERGLIVLGLVAQAAGMAWIAAIAAPALGYAGLVAPLVLTGAGVSLAMPAAQNAVLGAVAKSELGKASGAFNMIRFLGAVSGVAIAVAVFAATGGLGSSASFSAGFATALAAAAGLSLAGAAAGLALPSRRRLQLMPAKAEV
jgi:EmrB/QacA subfamily drug resistance transporter